MLHVRDNKPVSPSEELAAIAARRPGDPTPAVAATAGLTQGRGRGGSGDREQLARGRGVSQERAGEGPVTVPASGKMRIDALSEDVNMLDVRTEYNC